MAVLPSDIPTGLVKGQFYFVNEDNVDADTDPDLTVVTGTVRFTCSARVLRMPTKLATVIPLTFDAVFDSAGNLIPATGTGTGIEVPATDSPLFNPTGFTWRVDFDLREAATNYSVVIPSFDIQVPTGGTVDLTTAMPVDTSPGVLTVQGPQGIQGPIAPPATVTDTNTRDLINGATQTSAALDAKYASLSHTHANATSGAAGFLSAADKATLDAVAVGKLDITELNNSTQKWDQFPISLTDATPINGSVPSQNVIVRVAGNTVYAVFWGSDMNPYIASMKDGENTWQYFNLGTLPGNPLNAPAPSDEHNQLAMMVDSAGYIHVSGNHHRVPLNYIRSLQPNNIFGGWETPGMVGTNELEVTYPAFVNSQLFFYRDGTSSDGDLMLNKYDTVSRTWSRVGMILKGHDWLTAADDMSAYPGRIVYDNSGRLHLWWVWRDTIDISSNTDLCYMWSPDNGVTWNNAAGIAQTLPVTPANTDVKVFAGGSGHTVAGVCVDGNGVVYATVRMADGENRLYKRQGSAITYTVMGTGMGHVAIVTQPGNNIYAFYNLADAPYMRQVAPALGTPIKIFPFALPNWTPPMATVGNGSYTIRMLISPNRRIAGGGHYGGMLTFDITDANIAKMAAGTIAQPKLRAPVTPYDPLRMNPGIYPMIPDMYYAPAGARGNTPNNLANGTFRGQIITAARAGTVVECSANIVTAGAAGAKFRFVAYRLDGKVMAQSADVDATITGTRSAAITFNIGKNEQYVLGILHHSSSGASAVMTGTTGSHDSRIASGNATALFSSVRSGFSLLSLAVPAVDQAVKFLDPATGASVAGTDNVPIVVIKVGARPGDWATAE